MRGDNVMLGYYKVAGGDARGAHATADGCAPATSATATRTASTSSPAAQGADHQGRREHRAARDRRGAARASRPCSKRRRSACPTPLRPGDPRLRRRCKPGARCTEEDLRAHCLRDARPLQDAAVPALRRRAAERAVGQGAAAEADRSMSASCGAAREPASDVCTDMNADASATLRVRIWRGAAAGAFESYDVPRQASQTVLDVVTHVQRYVDRPFIPLRVSRRHVRVVRDDGQRQGALDVPHACRRGGGRWGAGDRTAVAPADHPRSGRRHDAVLRSAFLRPARPARPTTTAMRGSSATPPGSSPACGSDTTSHALLSAAGTPRRSRFHSGRVS